MSRDVTVVGTIVRDRFYPVVSRIVGRSARATSDAAVMTGRSVLAWLGIVILASFAAGAVAEGENLLINGGFDAEEANFPEFWSPSSTRDVIYCRNGAPEGNQASIVLKSDGSAPGTLSARQQGMTLVAGETYMLSGPIKTKGFQSRYAGLVVQSGRSTTWWPNSSTSRLEARRRRSPLPSSIRAMAGSSWASPPPCPRRT